LGPRLSAVWTLSPGTARKPYEVRFTPPGLILADKIMTETDWQRTIQAQCAESRIVQGGTNCRHPDGTGYCYLENCPKVKNHE